MLNQMSPLYCAVPQRRRVPQKIIKKLFIIYALKVRDASFVFYSDATRSNKTDPR